MKKQITALFASLLAISIVQAKEPTTYEELGAMTVAEFGKTFGTVSLDRFGMVVTPILEDEWVDNPIGLRVAQATLLEVLQVGYVCVDLRLQPTQKARAEMKKICPKTIREVALIPLEKKYPKD